jgi:5'-3' exonuclease
MGVPGFFSWLLKQMKQKNQKTNKIITKTCPVDNIDTLYIDANCLFHPQCYKVLAHYTSINDIQKLEAKMIQRILDYITYLIEFVNPKNIFISVDGPAPMAKLNQQRKRRYKSVQDNEIINQIKSTHGKKEITLWNNTCITPGTVFMENLHQQLLQFCKKLYINCIYSSYHTEGEGEHKILQEIKNNNTNDIVIYGLDADLIFLSLASGKQNIYLLRESMELNKKHTKKDGHMDIKEDLNYVSIDNVKICINSIINEQINNGDNMNDYTNDFIIICYFLGNDFLPNLPSIDIKNGGMDLLIKIYVKVHKYLGSYFIDNGSINETFLFNFINETTKYEKYYFEVKYHQYKQRLDLQKCTSEDLYDIDIWNFENVRDSVEDPVKLGKGDYNEWKGRYYNYYYSISSPYDRKNLIDNMCKNYIEGIHWVTQYYFQSCISNVWQYEYLHSPFVSDICSYLNWNKNINIKFKEHITIYPIVQLLSVIAPSCKSLLPKPYQKLMEYNSEILDLFPQHVKIDTLYKTVQHKCIPHIPNINIERIIEATNNIKLNFLEQERNKILGNFIYKK